VTWYVVSDGGAMSRLSSRILSSSSSLRMMMSSSSSLFCGWVYPWVVLLYDVCLLLCPSWLSLNRIRCLMMMMMNRLFRILSCRRHCFRIRIHFLRRRILHLLVCPVSVVLSIIFSVLLVVKSDRCLKDVDFLPVLLLLISGFLRIILVEFQFLEKMLKLMLLIMMSMLL
jgi:hypothetical protein